MASSELSYVCCRAVLWMGTAMIAGVHRGSALTIEIGSAPLIDIHIGQPLTLQTFVQVAFTRVENRDWWLILFCGCTDYGSPLPVSGVQVRSRTDPRCASPAPPPLTARRVRDITSRRARDDQG